MRRIPLFLIPAVLVVGCAQSIAPVPTAQVQTLSTKPLTSDQLIAFHEERVKNDPQGAIGWAMLGETYLQVARERDDNDLADKAEWAAKKSLEARTKRNDRAELLIANAYLEHHEFAEALSAVQDALKMSPDSPMALRMQADVLMELGRYPEAAKAVASIRELKDNPSALVTVARWEELNGRTDSALAALRAAAGLVDTNVSVPPSTLAYFHNRLGEALWRASKDDAAIAEFDKARETCPTDYKTLANLTRVAAHNKQWDKVIVFGTDTAKTAKMTDIEGLVAKAYDHLGRTDEAKRQRDAIDEQNTLADHMHEIAEEAAGVHHVHPGKNEKHTHDRLYALLLDDEGRHLDVALHLAKEDLDKRHDVYAWDTYAWTLFRSGQVEPAKRAMKNALALGTKDRKLADHASAMGL